MADNNRLQETFHETVRKWKKRPPPPVFNGMGLPEDKNNDYLCPICFEMITEAHMTKCGHTFCGECITSSLANSKRCPKCNFVIENSNEIFPNFLLNELIAKHQSKFPDRKRKCSLALQNSHSISELQSFLSREKSPLTIEEINSMLDILGQKKQQLEADCRESQIIILKEFLEKVRSHKEEELKRVQKQLEVVNADVLIVEDMLKNHIQSRSDVPQTNAISNNEVTTNHQNSQDITAHQNSPRNIMYHLNNQESANHLMEVSTNHLNNQPDGINHQTVVKCEPSTSKNCSFSSVLINQDGFNGSKYVSKLFMAPTLANRRKRMHEHYDDLEKSYFSYRCKDVVFSNFRRSDEIDSGLASFDQDLCKFSRYNMVRPLATLNYSSDTFVGSNIVSSIEFDKDNEYFAIAGVTKKIKVFEYSAVIRDSIDMHYAVNEMTCNSKISCISWSSFHKNMLASSDYEGTVTIWDAFTSQKVKTYQEHEKRCWSVDFNRVDPQLIASGSDDAKVKLWATNMEHSFDTLEVKANVCCVKFNPESRNYLAFGSADHCVHYYDLRNVSQAVEVFKGHKKAVSYVKFLNGKEIVSASTDSQLKLWNVNQSYSLRSFKGHLNEKNFVGLATDGDFVACGSENNSLYVYYKGLSTQVLIFKFETIKSILDKDKKEDDSNEFVSAVCWRMGSNVVLAANSQGNIKILELV
ncbi:hypothetical protein JTE90_002426 [Oedothorax gibbosus]|uniref:RING-type domain-containing protein n=1 Tax=Oedothorax gibbosus TaxID=931172 RepID=A0AAV6UTY0_9ARAC|nr:hypothetical protein JTE90_002426 [Oedothorax gibbosus]